MQTNELKKLETRVHQLVSVYIPTHNRSALLKRALDSVLAQTYTNIEILVCSDGSTDDTDDVMQKYCEEYSNIVYLKNITAQGACSARNKCINAAKGKYITGIDDDDVFHPRRIEYMLAMFHESYSFICTHNYEIDLSSVTPDFDAADLSTNRVKLVFLKELLNKNVVGNQVFTLRERMVSIEGFDVDMPAWQDYDTWVRLCHKYGAAKKVYQRTYYADIDHNRNRISTSTNRYKGCCRFYQKHHNLLSSAQVKNGKVRQAIIGGITLSTIELIQLFNIPTIKFWLKAWLIKLKLSNK